MVFFDTANVLGLPVWLLTIVLIWSLAWKGFALWKAARRNSIPWFVVLLIVNTVGILEILYIFLFSEMKLDDVKTQQKQVRKTSSQKKKSRR